MTYNDFVLQAMLSLAANPNYVESCISDDEGLEGVRFQSLDVQNIFIDAEALANEAKKRLDLPFDVLSSTQLRTLSDIQMCLAGINDKMGDISETLIDIENDVDPNLH